MSKEILPDSTAYLGEPENYRGTRDEILSLMSTINKSKQDFDRISNIVLLQEHFHERTKEVHKQLCQAIYLLGEMYGFTMSDDIIENVKL